VRVVVQVMQVMQVMQVVQVVQVINPGSPPGRGCPASAGDWGGFILDPGNLRC